MNKLCEQHSFHISAFHIIDYPSQFCCRRKKNPLLFPINCSNFNCHYRKSFFSPSFLSFFFSTQTRFKSWKNRLCVIGWCAKKEKRKKKISGINDKRGETIDLFRGRPLSQSSISSTNVFSLTFRAVSRYWNTTYQCVRAKSLPIYHHSIIFHWQITLNGMKHYTRRLVYHGCRSWIPVHFSRGFEARLEYKEGSSVYNIALRSLSLSLSWTIVINVSIRCSIRIVIYGTRWKNFDYLG